MDNLTHSLVGYVAAKAGLEKLSPYATPFCVVAANLPDCDWAALFGGRWNYLHHHRGITHSLFGVAVLIFILPTLFWLGDRLVARIRRRPPRAKWRGLLLAAAVVLPTHPFLDWTNNYGWRPFLPFDGTWIYGDIAFVLDPFFWLMLGGTAFLVGAFSRKAIIVWLVAIAAVTAVIVFAPVPRAAQIPLVARIAWVCGIAALLLLKRSSFALRREQIIARTVFAVLAVYLGVLSLLHIQAERQAESYAQELAAKESGGQLMKLAAMPTLANPTRWTTLAQTPGGTYRFDVHLPRDAQQTAASTVLFPRPQGTGDVAVAKILREDERARIWSGFARFPGAQVEGTCLTGLIVRLGDLRYTEPARVNAQSGSFGVQAETDCNPTNYEMTAR